MRPFLAPVREGFVLRAEFRGWRRFAIVACRGLNERFSDVLTMPWDEMLLAVADAQEIEAEDGVGAILKMLGGAFSG